MDTNQTIYVAKGGQYPQNAYHLIAQRDDVLTLAPLGGGFVFSGPARHFDKYTPGPIKEWVLDLFVIDGAEDPVDAYYGYHWGNKWNGWSVPAFELSEALLIMDRCAEADFSPLSYDEANDQFVQRSRDFPEEPVIIKPTWTKNKDGESVKVYGVGENWTWSRVCSVTPRIPRTPDNLIELASRILESSEPGDPDHRIHFNAAKRRLYHPLMAINGTLLQ